MFVYFRVLTLVISCVSLDYGAISLPPIHYIANAIVDSLIHFTTGALCWFVIFEDSLFEIVVCGVLSSLIDIDHFLAARSISLKAALSLPHRPIFHAVLAIPLVACLFWIVSKLILYLFKEHWLLKSFSSLFITIQDLPLLLIIAWSSHQLRDSTRRGLWFWPFASLPKTSYLLYIFLISAIPLTAHYFIIVFCPNLHKNTYSTNSKIKGQVLEV